MPEKPSEAEKKARSLRPRKRGDGSIFWDASRQRYRAMIVVSKPGTKIRRRSVSGKTAHEVESKAEELKLEISKGRRATGKGITLTRWVEQWMEREDHRSSTRRDYRSKLTIYITPSIGGRRITEIGAEEVDNLHRFMEDKGLSPTTIATTHGIVSAALNAAMREGRIGENIFAIMKPPRRAANSERALTQRELKEFNRVIARRDDRDRWEVATVLGLRQAEVIGLTWEHVHLDAEVPHLTVYWAMDRPGYLCACQKRCPRGALGKTCPTKKLDFNFSLENRFLYGRFVLAPPKTKSSRRIVPIPASLVELLKMRYGKYLEERNDEHFRDFNLVFTRRGGIPLDHGDDNAAWHTVLHEAGIEPMRLHSARHTAASEMLRAGVDDSLRIQMLGHSAIATTRSYESVDLDMLAKAMGKVSGNG